MKLHGKVAALAVGIIGALAAASAAQSAGEKKGQVKSPGETIVVSGMIDWLEKSDVAALTEGVVKQMEYQVGARVEAGKPIGYLHDERATLAVAKAKVAAEATGPIEKGEAQRAVAMAELARMQRANHQFPNAHSRSEIEKAEAEIKVAVALTKEAKENQSLAKAELKIAERSKEEHIIVAPFTGFIMERMKNPGEAVRADEAVVRLGRIDKLRFFGFVPLESSHRIQVGDSVDIRPTIEGADLPVEQKKFHGKVTAIHPELQVVGKSEVQILAEVENPEGDTDPGMSLRPGIKADMTIHLGARDGQQVGNRTAAAAPVR
jgi:multidrug efflux pump subunit AcrA (membrane-fusion protein)